MSTRPALIRQIQQLRNRGRAATCTTCAAPVAERQAPVLGAVAAQVARIGRELATDAAETTRHPRLPGPTSIPCLGLVTVATLLASLPLGRLTTPVT